MSVYFRSANIFFLNILLFHPPLLLPQTSHIERKLNLQTWWQKGWTNKFRASATHKTSASHTGGAQETLIKRMNPICKIHEKCPQRSQRLDFWVPVAHVTLLLSGGNWQPGFLGLVLLFCGQHVIYLSRSVIWGSKHGS